MYKVELTSIEDTIINIMVVQQIDDQDQTNSLVLTFYFT